MKVDTALKIGGVAIAVAGAACMIYVLASSKSNVVYSSEYDDFAGYTLKGSKTALDSIQECKNACTADDKCRGAAFDSEKHNCTLTRDDPFKATANSKSHVLVRRLVGQPESRWYDWAPPKCPASGVQTRMCVGAKPHCLGSSTRTCVPEVNYIYDVFDAIRVNA